MLPSSFEAQNPEIPYPTIHTTRVNKLLPKSALSDIYYSKSLSLTRYTQGKERNKREMEKVGPYIWLYPDNLMLSPSAVSPNTRQ